MQDRVVLPNMQCTFSSTLNLIHMLVICSYSAQPVVYSWSFLSHDYITGRQHIPPFIYTKLRQET